MGSPFVSCWLETRTGTRYEMPDMSAADLDHVCRQLDGESDTVTLVNVSAVVTIIPRYILARAGTGNRCFWEAPCTKLNPPGKYQKD